MAKFRPMVESCSKLPSLFGFCVFSKVHICFFAALCVLPFYPNVVPARESHPSVASLMSSQSHISFGRSFNFEDVLSLWLNLDKQKEPITQSIRNRRERGSRFKMMFYVIGSEDQSRVLLHTAPANRTKGVVEQFGTSGVPIPCRMKPTNYVLIWSNISIQLFMYVWIHYHDIIILIATRVVNICAGKSCHCDCNFFMNRATNFL